MIILIHAPLFNPTPYSIFHINKEAQSRSITHKCYENPTFYQTHATKQHKKNRIIALNSYKIEDTQCKSQNRIIA